MKTSLFDFDLPESLIATAPANPRDSARLLVVSSERLEDKTIKDFTAYLSPNDIVVFNDTKVIPARLLGKRGEAKIEVLLHKKNSLPIRGRVGAASPEANWRRGIGASTENGANNAPLLTSPLLGEEYWQCFAKPAKRLKAGDTIIFAPDFSAMVIEKCADGQIILQFETEHFQPRLQRYGQMPLPPYIESKRAVNATDATCYQTIYATHEGSVAAPTAGLHFSRELLAAIDATGAARTNVTLHVGGGTFLPVKEEDTRKHIMHSEWAQLSEEAATAINAAKTKGGRVIAVGTTSLRTLESASNASGLVRAFEEETDIFITPGYRFKCVDMLLTNFHLPRSTLFMLVSAFSGLEKMQAAYTHAIKNHYRFYSYGDACLLHKT